MKLIKTLIITVTIVMIFGGIVHAKSFKDKIINLQLEKFSCIAIGGADGWADNNFKKIGRGYYLFDDKLTDDISDDELLLIIYDDGEIIICKPLQTIANLL